MMEIRFNGRGGMGAVTAAELLAKAAAEEGKFCQAMPSFGVERRGAPVTAFTRIDDKFIRLRQEVYEPDYVVILDPTLTEAIDVADGLKQGGKIIINTTKGAKSFGFRQEARAIDATGIALKILGKPIVNTVMLGAFAKASGLVSIGAIKKVTKERFGGELGEKNAKAIQEAYDRLE